MNHSNLSLGTERDHNGKERNESPGFLLKAFPGRFQILKDPVGTTRKIRGDRHG